MIALHQLTHLVVLLAAVANPSLSFKIEAPARCGDMRDISDFRISDDYSEKQWLPTFNVRTQFSGENQPALQRYFSWDCKFLPVPFFGRPKHTAYLLSLKLALRFSDEDSHFHKVYGCRHAAVVCDVEQNMCTSDFIIWSDSDANVYEYPRALGYRHASRDFRLSPGNSRQNQCIDGYYDSRNGGERSIVLVYRIPLTEQEGGENMDGGDPWSRLIELCLFGCALIVGIVTYALTIRR